MRFAIWSPTNPRAGVTHVELFRQQIREVEIAFLGLPRIEDAMGLFARARAVTADQLTAFELIPRHAHQLVHVLFPAKITRSSFTSARH